MILGEEASPREQDKSLQTDPRQSWKLWYLNKTHNLIYLISFCYYVYFSAYCNYEDIVTFSEEGKV